MLIELHDVSDAASAIPSRIIAQQAAFILKDGSVVGLDGFSIPKFTTSINHQLFVVAWHRNHLAIMSANSLVDSGRIYTYDFTTGTDQT